MRRAIIILIISLMAAQGSALARQEAADAYRDTEQEIKVLNLINGLYLSQEQMQKLLVLAQKKEQLQEKFIQYYQQHSEEATEALEALRDELKDADAMINEDKSRRVNRIHQGDLQVRAQLHEELQQLVEEAKSVLTESQLYLLEEFKPCLVPPKGPLRIGQASDQIGAGRRLERIKELSDREYQARRFSAAQRLLSKAKQVHPYAFTESGQHGIQPTVGDIVAFFDKVRLLDDLEFEMQQQALADELKCTVLGIENQTGGNVDRKIETFLLHPSVIPVFRGRLAAKK